jgi:SNF2 family DNA or RNA helicase
MLQKTMRFLSAEGDVIRSQISSRVAASVTPLKGAVLRMNGFVPEGLRDYQVEGVKAALGRKGRFAFWDDPGLGKTAQALTTARNLTTGEILIVSPKVAFSSWMRQSARWLEETPVLWWGNKAATQELWQRYKAERRARNAKAAILLTNYHALPDLLARQVYWGAIIFDESHLMRNRKSHFFINAKKLVSPYVLQLTGSPIVNEVNDLWTQLNLLDEKKWNNFYSFQATFNKSYSGQFARVNYGVKNDDRLRKEIAPFFIRRHKEDVIKELPAKAREAIEYDLTSHQRSLYESLTEDWIAALSNGEHILAPNRVAQIVRLRQVLISPALLGDPDSRSGMLDSLREIVSLEHDAKRAVAIFTPYARAIPLIKAVLTEGANPLVPQTVVIQGGMTPKELDRRQKYFMEARDHRVTLLATIQSATSYDAYRASTAIFLGSHWHPTANEQSEDRLHRLGQTDSVRCLYFMAPDTIDEHIIDILDRKTTYQALAVDPHKLMFPRTQGRERRTTYRKEAYATFIPQSKE